MTPEDRRRVVPVFFIVGGALFAYSSFGRGVSGFAEAFAVLVGLVVLAYGIFRLRQERRRPPEAKPQDRDGAGPPA